MYDHLDRCRRFLWEKLINLYYKSPIENRTIEKILQQIKCYIWPTNCHHHPKWRNSWVNLIKIAKDTGISSIPTLFQALSGTMMQEKGFIKTQTEHDFKFSLLAGNMILKRSSIFLKKMSSID